MGFIVSSGIVTVLDDASVQIVAEEAAPLENLDPQVISVVTEVTR